MYRPIFQIDIDFIKRCLCVRCSIGILIFFMKYYWLSQYKYEIVLGMSLSIRNPWPYSNFDVRYDFRIKTRCSFVFSSRCLYLRYLCLHAHSGVQHILCCVFLHFVCPMLSVSLDCAFLIAPSVFSNVYLAKIHFHLHVYWKLCECLFFRNTSFHHSFCWILLISSLICVVFCASLFV